MQFKKISKDNRGITLVEIIIGMLIFAIITMTVIVIMYPTLNSIYKTRELSEIGMFADNIAAEITNDIKIADSIEVEKAKASVDESEDVLTLTTYENKIVYSTIEGRIRKNYDDAQVINAEKKSVLQYSDVVSSKYYENKSVAVSYSYINKKIEGKDVTVGCKISIDILNKEKESVIKRDYSVMSLILQGS